MADIKKYTKKNGETNYKFSIYTGINPLTGKKTKTTRRGFSTKRNANIEYKRIAAAVADGSYFEVQDKTKTTFRDVYNEWHEGYKNTVSESTLLKNDGMFNNRILPAFGDYLIASITTEMIQKQINEWKQYKNAGKWLDETSRIFKRARISHLIIANPCDLVSKPRHKPTKQNKPKKFYEKNELQLLLKEVDNWNNKQGSALIRLLAMSGMRTGEAIALNWEDLNTDNKTLDINKAVSRREVPTIDGDSGKKKTELYLKDPKNFTSTRTITIDQKTIDILLEWRNDNPAQLMFVSQNGRWLSPSKARKWLVMLSSAAELDFIPVHKLRHTYASLLFESGASIKEVQAQLGHDDFQTTMNVYTHTTKASIDSTGVRFSNYLDF